MSWAGAFHGRDVLVTGHTGFKGAWLALWLHRLGARVAGYATEPPTRPSNFELSRMGELLVRDYRADIRDAGRMAQAVAETKPDVVFHLAAQPLVRESYRLPRETFEVNAIGTASVLDAVRAAGRPCVVVVVTSDKCYENTEQPWGYRESDPMGGHDPYSASKGATELVAASYRRSFFHPGLVKEHGVKLATVRAGNVIGGGDWAKDRIVTDIIRHLVEERPIPVRNPRSVRPWQHVLEPLSGYLTLAARMLVSDDPMLASGWNFGPLPGDRIPVGDLVDLFVREWGSGSWETPPQEGAPHEAGLLQLSIDKAVGLLGWKPRWGVHEAVSRTTRWFRAQALGRADTRGLCLADIEAFEASVPARAG